MVAGVVACMLAANLSTAPPALGQFNGSYVPERIALSESANLFASWAGGTAVDGFVVELPTGWKLEGASVLQNAFRVEPVAIDPAGEGRYALTLEKPLKSAGELILRVRSGDAFGSDRVTVTPFSAPRASGRRQMMDVDRLSLVLHSDSGYSDPENRVASFSEPDSRPLIIPSKIAPPLDLHQGFSVSFWMKSTGLNQVVFSTWNGDEGQAYPIELVVGPAGRLRCFRGRPGEHQSMGSRRPVADGSWHRIMVTNEPDAGWMRLHIDGRTVDSLYSTTPLHISTELPLAIGGRVPEVGAYFDGTQPFSGLLDALRVQQIASRGAVRRAEPLTIDFDRSLPNELLAAPAKGVRLIRSDLSFQRPVDDFRAIKSEDDVLLRWHARDSESTEFIIERSKDGHRFDEVHRVRAKSRSGEYTFSDSNAGEGIAYYRLRQRFTGGGERISSTIKVGMGEEKPESVTLIGNFPNPFNNSTTISYSVTEQANVQMSVWDVSGHAVRQLVDRTQAPGLYEVQFHADELPSGTYFVRLHSERGTRSHKIILMK